MIEDVCRSWIEKYGISQQVSAYSGRDSWKVFESSAFGRMICFDNQGICSQDELLYQAEWLAHIACCSHADPKKVLLIDDLNPYLCQEFSRYDNIETIHCHFDSQGYALLAESLGANLPKYDRIDLKKSPLDSLHVGVVDVAIITSVLCEKEIESLLPHLAPKSLVLIKSHCLMDSLEESKAFIKTLQPHFRMIMPFFAPFLNATYHHFVFASNAFHPLADLQLQRADMLEGLHYYSAHIHQSSFVLPKGITRALRGFVRN